MRISPIRAARDPRPRGRRSQFAILHALLALAAPLAVRAQAPTVPLIPQPREVTAGATVAIPAGVAVAPAANADDRFALGELAAEMKSRGVPTGAASGSASALTVRIARFGTAAARRALAAGKLAFDTTTMRDEGYVLIVRGRAATVVAATAAGAFYGVQTLKQLVEGTGARATVREAAIRDWPAMRWRGIHDDLSRGPVPTLDYQKKQIRIFAAYKLNVYSPYYEHTLAYASNPLGAPPGGAMTRDDVNKLVAYAKPYHVEIVPEQEAFGHLHHLLKYELYAPLAETPHGHVLSPEQPGSMQLIKQMFAEIDTIFPSRFVHLGADETFELGRGQTAARVQREGIGPVYLGFLKEIEAALRSPSDSARGRRYLFWGDIARNHADLVRTLPKDLIAVTWEYDPHPKFDTLITPYTNAGLETWVAPGVNNWNRVFPDNGMALQNIQGFVRDGQRLGATGALNTSWDDDGEALFEQTWYGVLFGAAASWQQGESSIPAFQASYGRVFHGDTTGAIDRAQRDLIAAHALLDSAHVGDASDYLFWLDPYSADGQRVLPRVRPVLHDLRILAESAMVLVDQARPNVTRERDALDALALGARKIDFIGMKFQFADEMAQMYASAEAADTSRTGRANASHALGDIVGINGRMQDLRDGYSLIRDLYREAWLRENRPYWLQNVLARYDQATELWLDRMDRAAEARRVLGRDRHVPTGTAIGFPPPSPPPTAPAVTPSAPSATTPASPKPPA